MSNRKDDLDREKIKEDRKQSVQLEKELDQEALDVIFRYYDRTFKDLVDR